MRGMKIAAIVLRDLEDALRAGGADIVIAVESPADALNSVERLVRERGADLILIDNAIVSRIGKEKLKELKYRYPYPAIVELARATSARPAL
jgi:vacuolar-type H+-ATPase subunit F/Vma7